MFEKLNNSWDLAKASANVLLADKELLLFPVFSGIALIIVTVSFLVPLGAAGLARESGGSIGIAGYAVLFLFYFVWYFVILFFNSGLVGAALIRLDGGDPTVSDGLRIARDHLGPIIQYAFVAATVGMILRVLKERAGIVGKLLLALGGLAWNLATFLVVPVLFPNGLYIFFFNIVNFLCCNISGSVKLFDICTNGHKPESPGSFTVLAGIIWYGSCGCQFFQPAPVDHK